jgi:hypothetical protein
MSKITMPSWGAASLLCLSVSAHAATILDGVTLINQATVQAGGGYPYQITQPGSYRLSGNLVVPSNPLTGPAMPALDAIHILANGVTLDLGGFSIISSGGGASGLAISDTGTAYAGNSVRNGSIIGWQMAVSLEKCTSCAVQQLMLVNDGNGIFIGSSALISANVLTGPGIAASTTMGGTQGILCFGASVISGNTISGWSLGIDPGPNSLVSGNTVTVNQTGMDFTGPTSIVGNFLGGNDRDFQNNGPNDLMFNNNPKQ